MILGATLRGACVCLLATVSLSISGCAASQEEGAQLSQMEALEEITLLANFDTGTLPDFVSANNGALQIVEGQQAITGRSLNISLASKANWNTALVLKPAQPWNWSALEDFSLYFDVMGTSEEGIEVDLIMVDLNGDAYTRTFAIPAGRAKTFYAKMDGHDQFDPPGAGKNEFNFESGLRSNPPTWQSSEQQVYSLWGPKRLDLSGIVEIRFDVSGMLTDAAFSIDNIRLVRNPPMDRDFLVGIVDEFGQNAKVDYPGKVQSTTQLRAAADAERRSLSGQSLADRSKFHGWKNGPRLEATGFFRTEKVDGKWWLVDPEGYLYFSNGIDIIRLSNSSTMTGYDFDQAKIPARSLNDIISEDDQKLTRAPQEALPTRFLASEVRAKMFEWLPEYDEPLGKHFDYRRSAQSGPVEHGEAYSFYSANLERRYGGDTSKSYLEVWREVTLDRMVDWGFTSLGNWAEPEYYANRQIPFVAYVDINGGFKTVSSGFDFWHPVPDPFDPVFKERAIVSAHFVKEQIQSSPWCMGIFYDNEQSFGRPENDTSHFGVVLNALSLDAAQSPAKAAFVNILQDKYGTIEALNAAWQTDYASWGILAAGITPEFSTPERRADYSDLLYAFGVQYFSVIKEATKSVLPNHIYLGARMADWGRPEEIVRAAAEHSDVLSFNLYESGIVASHFEILEEVDRPALIGEFMFGSDDRGHFHPGISIGSDQQDRAQKYKQYVYSVLDNPYFVGAHYFQYMDAPITGRAYDGENYNTGFVAVTDIPYPEMVQAAKELNAELYQRRYSGKR